MAWKSVITERLMTKHNVISLWSLGLMLFFTSSANGQQNSEYAAIISKFEQWKALQYKKGVYVTAGRCNPDSMAVAGYKGRDTGIPEDLDVFFTDINQDGRLDALVTFRPRQCDGGLALMNAQVRILILSNTKGYLIDDKLIDEVAGQYKKGWLIIESVNQGTIYGTYFEQCASDGRGNASIKRAFEINYPTRKLRFY